MPRKRQSGSSTDAVRKYLAEYPQATPKEIVDGLAAGGVKVSYSLAKNVKYTKPAGDRPASTVKSGSKSQAVRKFVAEHPGATLKQVVDGLAAQGIKVSIALVSSARKTGKKRTSKTTGAMPDDTAQQVPLAAKTPAKHAVPTLADLMEAKKLVDRLGGIENAKAALDGLEKLQ